MAFPGTYNFNYYRGDRYEFVIRPKTANGDAFDLTGYSADFFVANQRGENKTQYEMQAVVDGSADTVTCTILPGAGESLTAGTYVYDMVVVFPNGNEKTYIWGNFIVYEDITKI